MARAEAGQSAADLKKQKALAEEEVEESQAREKHRQERKLFYRLLQQYESVPFHALDHALIQDSISHAYLFSGAAGSLKKELAVLFAQSLLTGQKGLIDEEKANAENQLICIKDRKSVV